MSLAQYKRAVGIIPGGIDIESLLKELSKSSFSSNQISIIEKKEGKHKKSKMPYGIPIVIIVPLLIALTNFIGDVIFPDDLRPRILTAVVISFYLGGLAHKIFADLRTGFRPGPKSYHLIILEDTEQNLKYAAKILDKYGLEEWEIHDIGR